MPHPSSPPTDPTAPSPTAATLLVACLCAQWCGSCREYRDTFDAVATAFPEIRFIWVDIEDEADTVDPIEVENFPTLLMASGDRPLFFGPLTPQRETLSRLVRRHADPSTTETAGVPDAAGDLTGLVARVRAFADA